MPIKSVKSDGPPPKKVAIAYNADERFIDAVMKMLHKDWGVAHGDWVFNKMMPKQTAIIYDRYDQILAVEMNNEIHYRKISKEEKNAAYVGASAGRVSDPFQDGKN